MKMMQKAGSENFSWAIFLSVFLGHSKTHIELPSDITIKSKQKTKKVLSSVFGVAQKKEEQTKEERTTTQTILGTFLNFFSS